jgi:hypothetical protein
MNKIILAFFVSSLLFVSCKKESCPAPADHSGKWVGKYGYGAATPTSDYTYFLNTNGELGVIDGLGNIAEAKGTWTVQGNTFRGTYRYLGGGEVYSVQATISADGKSMTAGTWGENENVSGSGTFVMTKQ